MNDYNCVSQELPRTVLNETKNRNNIAKIYWISKGASPSMYVMEYPDYGRRITKIISIDNSDIVDVLLKIYNGDDNKPVMLTKIKLYIQVLLDKIGNLSENNVIMIGKKEFTSNESLHLDDDKAILD